MTEFQKRGWSLLAAGGLVLVFAIALALMGYPAIGLVPGVVAGFFIGVAGMYLDPPWGAS